jgi:hypothetical protein
MLKPDPNDRCNLQYLYEYFGLLPCDGAYSSRDNRNPLIEKLGVLCDTSVLRIAELRKLVFMRVDHEFCLVQFLIYSAKEVWDLALFNLGDAVHFDHALRCELITISCCLALKGMLYLSNMKDALKQGINIFSIKGFETFSTHQIYQKDIQLVLAKTEIPSDGPVKIFFTSMMEFIESSPQDFNALQFYAANEGRRSDKRGMLNNTAKNSIKEIVRHPSLEVLQILFEKFLKLIEDCVHDEIHFKFRTQVKGVFCWKTFIETRHSHLTEKFILKRIKLSTSSQNHAQS